MEQVIFFFALTADWKLHSYYSDSNLSVKEINFLLTTGGERDT